MTAHRGLILNVEDEPGTAELVREILSAEGWEVQTASTGQVGLQLIEQLSPVLLLLDYALPDMRGTDFLEHLTSDGKRVPPFIVTTGVGDELLAVRMMKCGAADYLVKDSRFLEQLAPVVNRVAHEAELACRLAQSEVQLHFLAQHSPDILTIVDGHAVPRCQSRAVEAITGYCHEELQRPLFDFVPSEDRAEVLHWWSEVTATPEAFAKATFRLQCKNGKLAWLEAVAQNYLHNPALRGVIISARDISDRKAAEQHRLDMERRLLHSQKLESLGVLAGGIAHDFNNLLAAVVGNLDLALGGLQNDGDVRQSVEFALKASQRAADLTRQMLAYSGRGAFAIEAVDLSALVQENSQIFAVSVARNIELVVKVAPGLSRVSGDKGQLQQIVMNLLTNASEAIGTGAGTITLSTCVCRLSEVELRRSLVEPRPEPGNFVGISVVDSGCGMAPAVLERVFDPFFTTKRTGRGLGMAAVLGIVRGHSGVLFVESEPGKGTSVQVLFPAREPQAIEETSLPAGASPLAANGIRAKVLVVDDDSAVRSMAVRLLRHLGCQPLEATGGHEAIECVEKDPSIEVILMDLTMPNLGGIETAALLRRSARCPRIVLCSGFGEESMMSGVEAHGASAFLKKPYRLGDLRDVLLRALSR